MHSTTSTYSLTDTPIKTQWIIFSDKKGQQKMIPLIKEDKSTVKQLSYCVSIERLETLITNYCNENTIDSEALVEALHNSIENMYNDKYLNTLIVNERLLNILENNLNEIAKGLKYKVTDEEQHENFYWFLLKHILREVERFKLNQAQETAWKLLKVRPYKHIEGKYEIDDDKSIDAPSNILFNFNTDAYLRQNPEETFVEAMCYCYAIAHFILLNIVFSSIETILRENDIIEFIQNFFLSVGLPMTELGIECNYTLNGFYFSELYAELSQLTTDKKNLLITTNVNTPSITFTYRNDSANFNIPDFYYDEVVTSIKREYQKRTDNNGKHPISFKIYGSGRNMTIYLSVYGVGNLMNLIPEGFTEYAHTLLYAEHELFTIAAKCFFKIIRHTEESKTEFRSIEPDYTTRVIAFLMGKTNSIQKSIIISELYNLDDAEISEILNNNFNKNGTKQKAEIRALITDTRNYVKEHPAKSRLLTLYKYWDWVDSVSVSEGEVL